MTKLRTHILFNIASAVLLALTLFSPQLARGQQFNVIYTFTGGADGANPIAGVTSAHPGVLYGTASAGGTYGVGAVFTLSNRGSGWTLNPLHEFFSTPNDGFSPYAGVVIGPNGALYGTTYWGGLYNFGTVFELQPPAHACLTAVCYWSESILRSFQGNSGDGFHPGYGNLIFDQAGNIYGTTTMGGSGYWGTVFELSPSGGGWTENILHNFGSGNDGQSPNGGVIFDPAGNLYGATGGGGSDYLGTVFELSPAGGGTWTEDILYNFTYTGGGRNPVGTLVRDASGNLYGTASCCVGGEIFQLSYFSGEWVLSEIYSFTACGPIAGVTMDSAGNLYGVCSAGGADSHGFVFELINSSGNWTMTDLYDFTGGSDGASPEGSVVFDSSGNLYGTAYSGGDLSLCGSGCGTVWEITGLKRRR
ncbi:MAG: choice-of-anchor tandem repeat GloVer-containing protein [Candidatus Korobacteraceae bacterium]|jgi:uncharacterized repeat protein (TIGR03803 family)